MSYNPGVDTRLLELDADSGPVTPPRARVLVFGPVPPGSPLLAGSDTVRLPDAKAVADALHDGGFAAVVADPALLTEFFDEYRRNALILFMCVELMLNAVNLSFIALSRLHGVSGQIFVLFVMTVAAAEAAVGLAIVISVFRH